MNSKIHLTTTIRSLTLVALALLGFALLPRAQAVVPAPDGGYPNFTTAEGTNALQNLATGAGNTAGGWYSLFSDTTASFNTGVGAGTLVFNNADSNTAIGAVALLFNTTGDSNTAVGVSALQSNTEGGFNTATGFQALFGNTTGDFNTANGGNALVFNTTGVNNTANGYGALEFNTDGGNNTAMGIFALQDNTTGGGNTAVGSAALASNTTGGDNTGVGNEAGSSITGSGNVCIGAGVNGFAGESNITRIRNVYESVATDRAVYVTADGRIGTLSSSRRYKEEIIPMNQASDALFALKPVTFRYKKAIDPARVLSFGLIAEEVAEISPELITRDKEGKPQTVRYEAVNAMLLNEFLKEHGKVEKQACEIEQQKITIGQLQAEIRSIVAHATEQDLQIQRVRDQVQMNSPDARVVVSED
jgi:hypothetical protein